MKKFKLFRLSLIFGTVLLATTVFAQSNVTPSAPRDRQKMSCYGSYFTGSTLYRHDIKIAISIDWSGDLGVAQINVLKPIGNHYRILRSNRLEVTSIVDDFNEVISSDETDLANNLYITWRSDLDPDIPVRHNLKIGGVKYPLEFCIAVEEQH